MIKRIWFVFLFLVGFFSEISAQGRLQFDHLLDDWRVGIDFGITQFKGDIKQSSMLSKSEINTIGLFSLEKRINSIINVYGQLGKGKLNGSRRHDTYVISETTNDLNNPWDKYEENGVKFSSDIYEIAVVSKIDLEELYIYFRPFFHKRKNIHFYYNLGYGEILYTSMKRNMESGTYIYAYGYDDLNGNYESYKKLVKSKLFIYGFSVEYNINKNINLELSSVSRLSFTDHLDATEIKRGVFTSNDSYRVISFGIKYKL
jgi:hypothetical protein